MVMELSLRKTCRFLNSQQQIDLDSVSPWLFETLLLCYPRCMQLSENAPLLGSISRDPPIAYSEEQDLREFRQDRTRYHQSARNRQTARYQPARSSPAASFLQSADESGAGA